jgi:hypothetical protein
MDFTSVFLMVNTSLVSIVLTLAGIIYKDTVRRISRMDRQIVSALVALIALVNHLEKAPEHILEDLQNALKEEGGAHR